MRKLTETITGVLILIGLAWVAPFLTYFLLAHYGIDITPFVYIAVVFSLFLTASAIWLEILVVPRLTKLRFKSTSFPPASAIIAAYLPNEAGTIVETVKTFLKTKYPGKMQIILAYNSPGKLAVENKLKTIAKWDNRLLLIRVANSQSKAQNVNTALAYVSGKFVGIFDADHHPNTNSFTRAWRWLSQGYDAVQGHCVVRNGRHSWLTRAIAVEFEVIYALSHPGRNVLHGFGIFGGSNGFWKTEVLRKIGMDKDMLTEDIDASIRTVLSGYKIASDPRVISRELAPMSLAALWNQRLRWSQGWFQVSGKYLMRGLFSKRLSIRQKIGILYLLGWREIYPWISLQIPPLLAFWIWKYNGITNLNWFIPVFIATTIFTQLTNPAQILFSYFLAEYRIRKHKKWFAWYAIVSFLFYTNLKNIICLLAQLKEIRKDREWKITPRCATINSRIVEAGLEVVEGF